MESDDDYEDEPPLSVRLVTFNHYVWPFGTNTDWTVIHNHMRVRNCSFFFPYKTVLFIDCALVC